MVEEKRDVGYALKLNIEEINNERIFKDYSLDNGDNCINLLDEIGNYLTPLDSEYVYSADSKWVKFFKENIDSWFGESHGLAVIDGEYWLLSFAYIVDGVENWDMSSIALDDLESARKLSKLMSVVEKIGSSTLKKDGT